ncbi:hypothetical protein ACSVDA_24285 [Cytobacillus sp. Hm23]
MDLQEFDIVAYKGESLISKIIRFSTHSPYSHVAFVLDDLHVLQLNWNTPTVVKHLEYKPHQYDVYRLKQALTEKESDRVRRFIYNKLNSKYDFKFIFSRLLYLLFNTSLYNSKKPYNCDELIVDAFIGMELTDDQTLLTPYTLAQSDMLMKISR